MYFRVGMTGFEPATFCTQNKRATKLRYIPPIINNYFIFVLIVSYLLHFAYTFDLFIIFIIKFKYNY